MFRSIAVAAALVLTMAAAAIKPFSAAAPVLTQSYVLWGHDYGGVYIFNIGDSRQFWALKQPYGFYINMFGSALETGLDQSEGGATGDIHSYWQIGDPSWSVATNLQEDGNIVLRQGNGVVRWASGPTVAARRYNFLLTIQDDGNLVEYYSAGDPRVANGRKVLWATNRRPGAVTQCWAAQILPGANDLVFYANGINDIKVTIHNANALPLPAQAYRVLNNGQHIATTSFYVPPGLPLRPISQTRTLHTYMGGPDNVPQMAKVRIDISAGAVVASATIEARCFYKP